jgi:hypothetical protein
VLVLAFSAGLAAVQPIAVVSAAVALERVEHVSLRPESPGTTPTAANVFTATDPVARVTRDRSAGIARASSAAPSAQPVTTDAPAAQPPASDQVWPARAGTLPALSRSQTAIPLLAVTVPPGVGAVPDTAASLAASPASHERPDSPWVAAADAGVAVGRGSQNAGVATASFFGTLGRKIARSF